MLCLSGFELYSRWVPLVWSNLKFRGDKVALNRIAPIGDRLAHRRLISNPANRASLCLPLDPGSMQRMLNKDLTRFVHSLSRVRLNRVSERKAFQEGC